jgi:hypothetical protein
MEQIIVTKHAAVEKYIRESGFVEQDTLCVPHVSKEYVRGKHVLGILPYEIAAAAEFFTEVKITLPRGGNYEEIELTLDAIRPCVKSVQKYRVEKV